MAQVTNQVIAITLDLQSIKNSFNELRNLNAQLTQQLAGNFIQATKIISNSVDKVKITGKTIIDPKTGKDTAQVLTQMSTVFQDTNGKIQTFTRTANILNDGSLSPLSATLKAGGQASKSFADNISNLAKRAVLTIPIWLALRGAILGLFRVFSDGFNNIVAFDLALQTIKRNLSGTPEQIQASMEKIRTQITATSLALGVSTEKIADAVKQFSTLGFNTEDSLAGGIGATKLATVLFGDAGDTAEAFAGSLNLLIDRSIGAKSATEQMNEAFALVAELGKTNKDSIKGTAEGLKNFGGTAKSLGLTTKETITILATLSTNLLEGAKGGTLASSAFQQLVNNLDKVAGVLGISVNPQVQSTTQIFTAVIDEIERLGKTGGIQEQTRAINELFGGLKGAKPVRALIADLSRLKENFKITGDITSFNKAVDSVTDTLSKQVDIFHNVNKEIGKAFINGLTGADDFKDSLKQINDLLRNSIQGAKDFGQATNLIFKSGGIPLLTLFKGLEDATKKVAELKKGLINLSETGLKGGLSTENLTNVLNKLTTLANKGEILVPQNVLIELRKQLQKQVNDDLIKNKVEVDTKAKANVQFNDISFKTVKEEQDIRKLIVEDQINQAKAQGASTSELLKQEALLNKQFGIVETETDILKRKLATEQALTAEKRLQNKVGSDSLKLFEIAQTSGTNIAKQIGDVLAGNTSFDTFIRRGGEAVDIFRKQFADVFTNQQAQAFFKGNRVPGLENLTGGANITTQENFNNQLSNFNPQAQLALTKAENQIPIIRNDIKATIQMNVNVQNLSFREAVAKIKDEMSKEILNPQSNLGKALDEKIEKF